MSTITGNAKKNTLLGTASADNIYGYAGNDSLFGYQGLDMLYGGKGNDLLDGGAGADVMRGGKGHDSYIVSNIGDSVFETAGHGIDHVFSKLSWTLGDNIENLTLVATSNTNGTANISGYGNALNNAITGTSGENILDGQAGDDTLIGGAGVDILRGGEGLHDAASYTGATENVGAAFTGVRVNLSIGQVLGADEGSGDILSGIEDVTGSKFGDLMIGNENANILLGKAGVDVIDSGGGNDIVRGGSGADSIRGNTGADILTGGGDADTFVFGSNDTPVSGMDRITDFSNDNGDILHINDIDADTIADGNQDFADTSFIGTADFNFSYSNASSTFTWTQQIRYQYDAVSDVTHVEILAAGTDTALTSLPLQAFDLNGNINLTADDFIL
jgi:trimeric autotransporter adhesin